MPFLAMQYEKRQGRYGLASFFVAALLLIASCSGGNDSAPPRDSATLTVLHHSTPLAKVTLDSHRSMHFLVDTGASTTIVPAELYGVRDGTWVRVGSLCLDNGYCFEDFDAYASNSTFSQARAGYINGIIGMDLLSDHTVTIDYQQALLYLQEPEGSAVEHARAPISVPITYYRDGRAFADASLDARNYTATLLDTGGTYSSITEAMTEGLSYEPEYLFSAQVFLFNGQRQMRALRLEQYCVASACTEGMVALEGPFPAVGGSFFREFMVTFNFDQDQMILRPYKSLSHVLPGALERTGLQINAHDATDIVHVEEGSLAWLAGLRPGDMLIELNAQDISALGYIGVNEALSNPATMAFLIRYQEPGSATIKETSLELE